jgi:hypothetical protein
MMNSQGKLGGMSPPIKRHLELEIKALQNAPRDADKLERLLQVKQRQKEEALLFIIQPANALYCNRFVIMMIVKYLLALSQLPDKSLSCLC